MQPGGDVDAVAEEVLLLGHDIAEVHADAILNAPVRRNRRVALAHTLLQGHRHPHGLDRARELDEQAIAGGVRNPAAELFQERIG